MDAARTERRLVAILAADVVGYSRMMERDECGTLARLKAQRRDIVEPLLREHGGRLVKLIGDGALCEFASAVDAVTCAVAIQRAVAERAESEADDARLWLRIGINLGDVIADGEDLYGDGVNVAARLEPLAPPGGVVLSGAAFEQVETKLDLRFEPLGAQQLKNLARPVPAYRLDPAEIAPLATARPPPAEAHRPAPRPAVAVLPFTNLSEDPEQEYFSDGLAEDLIAALAAWRSFPVVARGSSFTFKGQVLGARQLGRELGARYLLQGSVRKQGSNVRVAVQLVDTETGHQVWAERFDRPLDDVFAVQDEITRRIAAVVEPELEHAELRRLATQRPTNLTAWDLYLRGMAELHNQRMKGHAPARALFERATAQEPGYADAWAGLAWTHVRDFQHKCTSSPEASLAEGLEAAKRAVELDANSAIAHYVLSTAYVWREELEASLAELRRALELNPYEAHWQMALGNRLDLVGRTEEGIARIERALEINPRDPYRYHYMAMLARALLARGQADLAESWMRSSVSLRPDEADKHFRHAACLAHLDRVAEAREALARAEALEPGFLARWVTWQPYRDEARNVVFFAGLRRHALWPPDEA